MMITRKEIEDDINQNGIDDVRHRLLQMKKTKREEYEKVISEIENDKRESGKKERDIEAIEISKRANYLAQQAIDKSEQSNDIAQKALANTKLAAGAAVISAIAAFVSVIIMAAK